MASNEKEEKGEFRFGEPELVSLVATHPWGPWARRARTRLELPGLELSLRNPGPEPLALTDCELEPLRNTADGSRAPAGLRLEAVDEQEWPLAPGQVGILRIGGEGRWEPGRYGCRLILGAGEGRPAAAVPVNLTVRAAWLWAFGFMILGLAFLGLLLLLAGRTALNERLAEALAAQRELHELLESAPPILADRPLARRAKEEAAAAVESLARPRPFGFVDPRLARAERHLEAARSSLAALRARAGDETPGWLAVNALDAEWKALAERLEAARKRLEPAAGVPAAGVPATGAAEAVGDFLALLTAVQRAQWRQRMAPLPLAIEQGLGPHVDRAHLALAAGEQERARKLAQLVTRWLQRAARQLDRESDMLLTWRSFAGAILARAAFLERARVDADLPEPVRQRLGRSLSTARELLAPASLEGFRDADRELQRAEVELTAVRSERLIERLQATVTAVEERTSLEWVAAMLDEETTGGSKEDRVREVLERWHETVATVEEAELKESFLDRLAALESVLEEGDLQAVTPGFGELVEAWLSYQEAQTGAAMATVLDPYCGEQTSRLRSQFLASSESLALLQPHPTLDGLEAKLDLIEADLEAGFSGVDCLERLTARSGELLEIGNKLFSTFLLAADLTPRARLASAEHSEVTEAVVLARRLMREPRPLRLDLRTPRREIQVDRAVVFEVGDLGPAWGPGTSIRIDFGDGSPALLSSAEEMRQEPLIRHRYTRPRRAEVQIVATQGAGEGVFEPAGEVVGEGRLAITVSPSPISLARSLADFFLSLRFLLALAVGLLIQGWRFYDEHPFGSRPRDYLEAFALGVGAQGVVEGFSGALLQFVSGG